MRMFLKNEKSDVERIVAMTPSSRSPVVSSALSGRIWNAGCSVSLAQPCRAPAAVNVQVLNQRAVVGLFENRIPDEIHVAGHPDRHTGPEERHRVDLPAAEQATASPSRGRRTTASSSRR